MASVEKYTHKEAINIIKHCNREIYNDRNKDITSELTHLNYDLTPRRGVSHYNYYLHRKEELYVYNRSDIKTLAGWIVTAPREINSKEELYAFFESTYKFLEERYGKENVIQATVHFDEGKRETVRERWTNKVELDEHGKPVTTLVHGRPHLHLNFIPVARNNNPKHVQVEKICANDVLTPVELRNFHGDLKKYLDANGIKGQVLTGSTKQQGRNMTVAEIKEKYELEKELKELREYKRNHEYKHDLTRERERW